MSDPKRWLDEEGGATRRERDLLRAGAAMEPPASAEDKVWLALLAQIGPPGGGPGAGLPGGGPGSVVAPAAGASAAGAGKVAGVAAWAGVVKSMLIGGVGAAIFVAGYAAVVPAPPPAPPASATAPAQVAEGRANATFSAAAPAEAATLKRAPGGGPEAASPRAPAPRGERAVSAAPYDGAAPPAPQAPPPEPAPQAGTAEGMGVGSGAPGDVVAAERISRLREERAMLEEARDALRRGDAAGALHKLEQARARFPGGVLVQEREALAIEALSRTGQRAAASARAAAFLSAYPTSPHATRLQSFVQ